MILLIGGGVYGATLHATSNQFIMITIRGQGQQILEL